MINQEVIIKKISDSIQIVDSKSRANLNTFEPEVYTNLNIVMSLELAMDGKSLLGYDEFCKIVGNEILTKITEKGNK